MAKAHLVVKASPPLCGARQGGHVKIATYNINGIHGRLPRLLAWLEQAQPDVVCLQELKTATFPQAALRKAGYHAVWNVERAYNGVAILAKAVEPIVTRRALPGADDDKQCRYIEAAVNGLIITSIYLPNGNPRPGPKFNYKLSWFERLHAHAASFVTAGVPVVLAGDFNVVPTPADIYQTRSWDRDALVQPECRAAFTRLLAQGFTDAVRALHPSEVIYTFWDYKRNAWSRNAGLRIDHFLLSADLVPRLHKAEVDTFARGEPGSSDHAPVWITLR